MTVVSLGLLVGWAAAVALFVSWRAGVLQARHGEADMLNDGLTSLVVRGTALVVLVLVFLLLRAGS